MSAGQAAMEYLMTYGWALLVIVIVIAILVSLNLFSAPQGCSFEHAGFTCGSPVIDTNGLLFLPLTNANANNIKLVGVVCTADKSSAAPAVPTSGQSGNFGDKIIYKQSTFDLSSISGSQPTCTKGGSAFSGPAGTEFSGKVWVFYRNEEDGSNYPVRTISANLVTKTVLATGTSGGSPGTTCSGSTPVLCAAGTTYAGTCKATEADCTAAPAGCASTGCTTPPNVYCCTTGPHTGQCMTSDTQCQTPV